MDEVLGRLAEVGPDTPYSYVVTPNVDHVVRLSDPEAAGLRHLYERAGYCLCDSRVLQYLGRWNGLALPLVTGSDLTARLLIEVVKRGDRIAVVGGDRALIKALERRYPGIDFRHHQPPMGLRTNPGARESAARFIAESRARFAFIAVGSPQQEMIAEAVLERSDSGGVALCIGASLDFLTGKERRAPKLLQRLGLEWTFRLLSDPKRMWRRYLVEGPRVFLLAAAFRRGDAR
jgi:exopolysaccharide biosynthesis WecB/TagA/CpsF family protein